MKSDIIRYKPEHALELFKRRVAERDVAHVSSEQWVQAADKFENAGVALTLTIDGKVEACFGIATVDNTMGECWAFIPTENKGFIVFRNIMKALNRAIKENNYRRLHAFAAEGFEQGAKLLKGLGFKYEGCLMKYGPSGENMNLYARVF